MIAYVYPPLGGSGVQRTLKFSKYLPEFGWQPYVVCGDDGQVFGDGLDESLAAEIPAAARVWRRRFVNPLGLRRWVQQRLGGKAREGQQASGGGPADGGKAQPGRRRRLLQRLTAPLGPFEFPAVDAALYWALAIVPGCLRLIRREQIDVIYSTSFPYSDHVTGYFLKELSGKPWVADFRDPWTQNASARNRGWRYRVDRWVEGRVLRTADRVIGVTPSYTADLRRLAAGRAAEDFVTIENGYDGADFMEIASQKPLAMTGGRVTLAHVGFVYDGTALPFLRAVEALGEGGAGLRVRFVGGLGATEQSWLAGRRLAAEVVVEPRRPHGEALEAMRAADFLLLFVIPGIPESGHYPGKLFEYMASGRPILLIGSPGDAARLVQQSGTGCFLPDEDGLGLVEAMRQLVNAPEGFYKTYYHPRREIIEMYERRALAEKLAESFTQMEGKYDFDCNSSV